MEAHRLGSQHTESVPEDPVLVKGGSGRNQIGWVQDDPDKPGVVTELGEQVACVTGVGHDVARFRLYPEAHTCSLGRWQQLVKTGAELSPSFRGGIGVVSPPHVPGVAGPRAQRDDFGTKLGRSPDQPLSSGRVLVAQREVGMDEVVGA